MAIPRLGSVIAKTNRTSDLKLGVGVGNKHRGRARNVGEGRSTVLLVCWVGESSRNGLKKVPSGGPSLGLVFDFVF